MSKTVYYRFPGKAQPLPNLSHILLFLAFGALIAAKSWQVPHAHLFLIASVVLGVSGAILCVPQIIYEDQPVSEHTLHKLREEAARFPLVAQAWDRVCDGHHPTWKQLDAIIFWVRRGYVPLVAAEFHHSDN
jgi:hypothetical protein